MSNNIKTFNFNNKELLVYMINGEQWFVGRYVCDILEYSNPRDAISRHCNDGGVVKRYIPTSSGLQEMTMINLSNLLRLTMRSKMEKAIEFQDWIVEKVIPSILQTGSYSIFDNSLTQHTNTKVQIKNSKDINGVKYNEGGVIAIKEYNTLNCMLHLGGLNPKEVRDHGKKIGLKSKDCTSAKSVLRKINPEIASAMSLADSIQRANPTKTIEEISKISKKAIPFYLEYIHKIDEKIPELN